MIAEWDRKLPGRSWNVFAALGHVVPSHLMDNRIFDFAGLQADGDADENGDMAFDTEDFSAAALPLHEDEDDETHLAASGLALVPAQKKPDSEPARKVFTLNVVNDLQTSK